METSWLNLCRCCLSVDCNVSLLDTEQKVHQKFFEVTSLKISADDGLPQKICKECLTLMNFAYNFRTQCLKMDNELRIQLKAMLNVSNEDYFNDESGDFVNSATNTTDDPVKQLETVIKQEQNDSDDECYYVLVIDSPKSDEEKENENVNMPKEGSNHEVKQVKLEYSEDTSNSVKDEIHATQNHFEDSIHQFLMNDRVPVNVPATILENEEESQDNEYESMNIDETQDSASQDSNHPQITEVENLTHINEELITDDMMKDPKNIIKILTSTGSDGTILLKSDNGVQYLAETQLVNDEEDGDGTSQEVILCEGESQFQILKYDGSELVIEYADDSQIATVLQQEDGSFLCDCGEQFQDLTEYEKHQYKHNPAGENLCNLCGKGFESPEILTGHMLLHSVTGVLINCPFCNQLIKRTALTQHIKYGHNNIKPRCNICLKTFANPNNLKRHMMIHSDIREFECDICFKKFRQKITMQTHRLTHVHPFTCSNCDKTFPTRDALNNHNDSGECSKSKVIKVKAELMKTVKQEVTTNLGKLLGYACSLCKKMFSVESALEQHVESTHIINPTELLCSECGEVLPSKKDMQMHSLTHKNSKSKSMKRFECSICGKGCASQAMLQMHERVHTNERPFPCQLCSLRFKTKTHLRTHQLTHTREKKFGCSICMKFFALKGNLVVHLRTHTGERPYVCSLCGEAFIDSKYLKKHKLKKHTIENVSLNQYENNQYAIKFV